MRLIRRLLKWSLILGLTGFVLAVATLAVAYWLIEPRLPTAQEIRDVRMQVPLRVYSRDGKLIAMFGETKRTPVDISEVPPMVRNAFLAIEDARFYEHPGIDWRGIARAVWLLATTDDRRVPGGSTITQQVARNFFLSNEYSLTRKFAEIFLALRLERELSKDEILELYLNKIFFGYRSYGVAAAAEFYYGKKLSELDLAEAAMLASIPKFPSSGNPLTNPDRALVRRNYVLERMAEIGSINREQMLVAQERPSVAFPHEPAIELDAPYLAEMVRVEVIERIGADALENGYRAITSIDSRLQEAANAAVRDRLLAFDQRKGFRGPEAQLDLAVLPSVEARRAAVAAYRTVSGLVPALVVDSDAASASLLLADGQTAVLDLAAVDWARKRNADGVLGPRPKSVTQALVPGDLVRIARDAEGNWRLSQLPRAQAALAAIDPEDGAIRAITGGFSFTLSKFNRATQSNRQPGSSFKPFVYAAAFERGFNPASIVNDAPLAFADPSAEGGVWKPQNDNEKFYGPMRLREAMVLSRNLVSVRLLDAIGVGFAREYMQRFGFPPESLPQNLSLALGTSSLPPLALARGYSVFANGGYGIDTYAVERIEDDLGNAIFSAKPKRACRQCIARESAADDTTGAATADDLSAVLAGAAPIQTTTALAPPATAAEPHPPADAALAPRVIDERNAFLITSVLRDVVKRGTGHGAMVLGRNDLAGKTGTTNNYRDAWFSGFNPALVATVWMGHDDFTSLGDREFAAQTALPIWIDFMRVALDGMPQLELIVPNGITTAPIDGAGNLLSTRGEGGIVEFFKTEDLMRLSVVDENSGENQDAEQQGIDLF
ncbi:MAG: penicillin-binding protein 1A [Xanthomonadales bacterium]|jgi:penicillin-binding protein 1A|nr:penicillin-binding protein 1A [Xanthomonadales bacterium]MBK7144544.1 penicillin-binding protein 1A [Xanthomonadales bacterium]MCC6560900.1 penicillin-binding protein 1A [Xanthomonadales bacterium]